MSTSYPSTSTVRYGLPLLLKRLPPRPPCHEPFDATRGTAAPAPSQRVKALGCARPRAEQSTTRRARRRLRADEPGRLIQREPAPARDPEILARGRDRGDVAPGRGAADR